MINVEMLRPTADEMLSGLSADEAMKQRILMKVDGVQKLPEVAGEMLGGLTASPALRHRILVDAERKQRVEKPIFALNPKPETKTRRVSLARFTPAVGMALVLALMIGLGMQGAVPLGPNTPDSYTAQNDFPSYMAGSGGGDSTVPQFRSLYAGEGANPPMIGINGRFYRMLTVPVPSNVLGSQVSEIHEVTDEPALAKTVGTMSNVVAAGTPVYAVDGISHKTACIAEVDGSYRLFQRVGYASGTILGNEQIDDTLDVGGKVTALELSGVGIITDEAVANNLIYSLSEFATYYGNDLSETGQALTIYLRNGLSLQLMVDGDILSGCGAWYCAEFFQAFNEALGE